MVFIKALVTITARDELLVDYRWSVSDANDLVVCECNLHSKTT